MLNKKAQEEIVGFALIIILVIIILLVFLSISLKSDKQENVQDYEVENFLQSILQYTTDCQGYREDFRNIEDLIFDCKNGEHCLVDERKACDVLEEVSKEIIEESWQIGENNPAKAYNFTIILDEHMIMKGTSMTFLLKVKPSDLDKVSKDIYVSPYIANLTITSGHYNLLIVTHPMSDKDKLEFIKAVNSLPGDSIIELVSSINLETFMCKPIELPKTPVNLLIRCDYCHREFSGEVFSKAVLGRKRYFCSPICQEKYEERAKKYIRGELFKHPEEEKEAEKAAKK